MAGLLLVAGSFLIIAALCTVAWANGYSPEAASKKSVEIIEEHLAETELRLEQIATGAEVPRYKREVEELEARVERLNEMKANEEEILSISNQ